MTVSTTIEEMTQQFVNRDLDYPARDVSTDLMTQLGDYYESTGMSERQPAKAQFLVERGHRSAVWAGLWHVITSQLVRTSLPNLRQYDTVEECYSIVGPTSFHDFTATASRALAAASETVLAANTAEDWHYYRPLWELVVASQDSYRKSWFGWKEELERNGAVTPPTPPVEPGPSSEMQRIWAGSAYEISKSALWALANHQVANRQADECSSTDLRSRSLADAARMNWATTIKRAVHVKLFPHVFDEMPDDATADFFAPASGSVFVPNDGVAVCEWSHGSLQTGPWRSPGMCAGRVWCEPALEQDKADAEEYFEHAERLAQAEILRKSPYSYNGGLAVLVHGAYIAEKTIHQPS